MQRRHRIRHRLMWVLIAPLAIAALVIAFTQRVEMPVMVELPVSPEKGETP